MNNLNVCPVYFPNIYYMSEIIKYDQLTWNLNGIYRKRTYRNRTFLYGPNGVIKLSIPVNKIGETDNEKFMLSLIHI